MTTMFHHVFFLKKSKGYREGPIPIYLRITIAGKRAELSVKRKIDPSKWISVAGKMKGTTQLARTFNTFLISLENRLYDSYLFLLREKEEITARSLKNKYTGESDKQRMLMAIFQQHNDQIASLVPKQFSKGTLERYKTSMSHTLEFMRFRYQISDIDVRNIDHVFVEGYDYYLRVVRNCANNSTVKYLKNFKKIIRICIANGWINRDPFTHYKGKLKVVTTVYLSDEELQIVLKKEFTINRLIQVKDIFIFCCFTGLAYADVKKMNADNIVNGCDGKKWLFLKRTKTGTPITVPLLPSALELLGKYENHSFCLHHNKLLPVLSNQKTNSYLKEIADICGIHKKVTFHTARHTFATTVTLNNDVPIESVSRMLGHSSISATQHYAKILDKKISRDMQSIFSKFH